MLHLDSIAPATRLSLHAAYHPQRPVIRAVPPGRTPLLKPGCSCGGQCPACCATIASPDHPAEREADAVASQVMAMPRPAPTSEAKDLRVAVPTLQRKIEDEDEPVQAKAEPGAPAPPVAALPGLGGGSPLAPSLRSFFEPRFGRSFAGVRVHDGGTAHAAARGLHAEAFTYGRDIVFARGRYAPESMEGRRLIAHELTHVVQQSQASPTVQRWTVAGDEATSDAPGDTLWGLAQTVSGNGRDWTCIAPKSMKTADMKPPPADFNDHYELYVRNGDTFDVSNLKLKTGPTLSIHLFTAKRDIDIAALFYPGMTAGGGDTDVDISTAAGDGKTPIDDMIIFGHAAGTTMFGGVGTFDPTTLTDEPVTFGLASHNLLPRRCWFTRDATVRSVGCSSTAFAGAFARHYLRKGSSIVSTTSAVSPCCGGTWTRLAFTSSSAPGSTILDGPFSTTAGFHGSSFWATVAGAL